MQKSTGLLNSIRQHDKLGISVSPKEAVALSADEKAKFLQPNRLDFYFFVFVYTGTTSYTVDLETCVISEGQLLLVLPNQIVTAPESQGMIAYYKIGFDENTLALLPQQFASLLNPLNLRTIQFDNTAKERVKSVFEILQTLLHSNHKPKDTTIILAHLNALLTEVDSAYFENCGLTNLSNTKLSKYIEFKLAVETHLTEQYSIHTLAEQIATTTSSLYGIVKEFSGVSPKEFVTNRLMLEAQRKLRYSKLSVKELAYELGFSDPDYFSRLFKKSTGKSVSQFLESIV